MATANYALDKVRSIRTANAAEYNLGACVKQETHALEEAGRIQEMNLSMCRHKQPELDLVKDIPGYKVPQADAFTKEAISEHSKDR